MFISPSTVPVSYMSHVNVLVLCVEIDARSCLLSLLSVVCLVLHYDVDSTEKLTLLNANYLPPMVLFARNIILLEAICPSMSSS